MGMIIIVQPHQKNAESVGFIHTLSHGDECHRLIGPVCSTPSLGLLPSDTRVKHLSIGSAKWRISENCQVEGFSSHAHTIAKPGKDE